jgi:hypothetical protein
MTKEYRIYLDPVDSDTCPLEGGYYGGNCAVNGFIYGRVAEEEAFVYTNEELVITTVLDARSRGYPAHSVPPITIEI